MKKIYLYLVLPLCLSISVFVNARSVNPLSINSKKLSNGLEVIFNNDSNLTDLSLSIVVKAGSANDPENATGVAHYFEHMMFKGTDSIGSLNYEEEEELLASISELYEKLAIEDDKSEREKLLAAINKASVRALRYSNPAEFNEILELLGCYNINAFTSYDYTKYQCTLPATSLERVLQVYAEQFRNPVFRDFQSELETVYDEKNSYIEQPFYSFFDNYRRLMFKDTPYENAIIGKNKHLKSPSVKQLENFYNTYYVPNNMALIIMGNLNEAEAFNLVNENFSVLDSAELPPQVAIEPKPHESYTTPTVSMTPTITMLKSYKVLAEDDPEVYISDICSYMLLNESQTGVLDNLAGYGLFTSIQNVSVAGIRYPVETYMAISGYYGYGFRGLSDYFDESVQLLVDGEFEDEDLVYAKVNYIKEYKLALENQDTRMSMIERAFVLGLDWDQLLMRTEKAKLVSRADVVRIAKQLYSEPYLEAWSNIGSDIIPKMPVPDWITSTDKNLGNRSSFGTRMLSEEVNLTDAGVLDFRDDVVTDTLNEGYKIFATKNPYNDIYSLSIKYHVGTLNDKLLSTVESYMSIIGSEIRPINSTMLAFRKAEAVHTFNSSTNTFTVTLTGNEAYLKDALKLLGEKMSNPNGKVKQYKLILNSIEKENKIIASNSNILSFSLMEYLHSGEASVFNQKLPLTALKYKTPKDLIKSFKKVLDYNADFIFTGNTPVDSLKSLIRECIPLAETPKNRDFKMVTMIDYETDKVFCVKKRKASQNTVFIIKETDSINSEKERALAYSYMSYFGNGSSSVVNKHLRINTPLTYAHQSDIILPAKNGEKGFLFCVASVQADKTPLILGVYNSLFNKLPSDTMNIRLVKINTINGLKKETGSFRDYASTAAYWSWMGYDKDPRQKYIGYINGFTNDDLRDFYKRHFKSGSNVYGIVGNLYATPKRTLKLLGEPKRLKAKHFMVF